MAISDIYSKIAADLIETEKSVATSLFGKKKRQTETPFLDYQRGKDKRQGEMAPEPLPMPTPESDEPPPLPPRQSPNPAWEPDADLDPRPDFYFDPLPDIDPRMETGLVPPYFGSWRNPEESIAARKAYEEFERRFRLPKADQRFGPGGFRGRGGIARGDINEKVQVISILTGIPPEIILRELAPPPGPSPVPMPTPESLPPPPPEFNPQGGIGPTPYGPEMPPPQPRGFLPFMNRPDPNRPPIGELLAAIWSENAARRVREEGFWGSALEAMGQIGAAQPITAAPVAISRNVMAASELAPQALREAQILGSQTGRALPGVADFVLSALKGLVYQGEDIGRGIAGAVKQAPEMLGKLPQVGMTVKKVGEEGGAIRKVPTLAAPTEAELMRLGAEKDIAARAAARTAKAGKVTVPAKPLPAGPPTEAAQMPLQAGKAAMPEAPPAKPAPEGLSRSDVTTLDDFTRKFQVEAGITINFDPNKSWRLSNFQTRYGQQGITVGTKNISPDQAKVIALHELAHNVSNVAGIELEIPADIIDLMARDNKVARLVDELYASKYAVDEARKLGINEDVIHSILPNADTLWNENIINRGIIEIDSKTKSVMLASSKPEVPVTPTVSKMPLQIIPKALGKPPEAPPTNIPDLERRQAIIREVTGGRGGMAPPITPPIQTPPGPIPEAFAANIRLSKYPEDIRATIKEWADANPNVVQEARRGIRGDEQVLSDAKDLVESMGGNFERLKRSWKPGEAWNAEELMAIRGTLRAKSQTVKDAADVVKTDNSSANQARLLLALEEQGRIQEMAHGLTAEAGRALRSFRQYAFNAIKSNDTEKLEELVKRYGGRDKMDEIANAIGSLDVNDPVAVNNFVQNIRKPKFWDYVIELFYNSILSGPKTHIVNSLSNMVTTSTSPIERLGAAIVEQPLARMQGRQVQRFFNEVPADAVGAYQGISEGARAAVFTLRNGIRPQAATKWEFQPRAFKGVLGKVINAPSSALESADAMNYAINYRAALNALSVRAAKTEGLTGNALVNRIAELKGNPTEDIIKAADRNAEYRLFRQKPGEFTSRLIGLRDTIPALRFVVPFLRTPVNLVKFGLERSPVGVINPSLWRNLAAKNPAASDQIARIGMGSMIAAAVALLFAEGRITGSAPTKTAERERFYREGKQPFAIRVGDTWIQYQRLEPLNQTLSQVAAAVEAIDAKDKSIEDKVPQAVFTIAENLVSQTYMSSLSDLLETLNDPERQAGTYAQRLASGLMPASSLQRTIAQALDKTVRKPGTALERFQTGIPGLSQKVPSRLGVFGEDIERKSPAISPIQITPAEQTAIDAELARLRIEVGFVGNSANGQKLTVEEQRQYQILAGRATLDVLGKLINSPAYVNAIDEMKAKAIQAAIRQARDVAGDVIIPPAPKGKSTPKPKAIPIPKVSPIAPKPTYTPTPAPRAAIPKPVITATPVPQRTYVPPPSWMRK